MSKIVLVTHGEDLDGKSCAILVQFIKQIGNTPNEIEVHFVTYKDVDTVVSRIIKEEHFECGDRLFITDIAPKTLETYDKLDEFIREQGPIVMILDHHPANEFAAYKSYVDSNPLLYGTEIDKLVDHNAIKSCGTFRFYNFLMDNQAITLKDSQFAYLNDFVERVRRYDTYEWADIFDDSVANQLNALCLEMPNFVDYQVNKIKNIGLTDSYQRSIFTEGEQNIVDLGVVKRDKYVESIMPKFQKFRFNEYNIGIVFGRKEYASPVGNIYCKENDDVDMAILIDMTECAACLRTVKNDVNLTRFSKQFGGGGHPKASGITFKTPEDAWGFYKIIRNFDRSRRNIDGINQRREEYLKNMGNTRPLFQELGHYLPNMTSCPNLDGDVATLRNPASPAYPSFYNNIESNNVSK